MIFIKNILSFIDTEFYRYIIVGGLAFIVDIFSLYIFTEYYHIHYLISAIVSFIFGMLVNYFLSVIWVFKNRSIKSKHMEFVIFVLIGIVGLFLNEFVIWIFTEVIFMIHYLYSKVISAFLIFLFNFYLRKKILFSPNI